MSDSLCSPHRVPPVSRIESAGSVGHAAPGTAVPRRPGVVTSTNNYWPSLNPSDAVDPNHWALSDLCRRLDTGLASHIKPGSEWRPASCYPTHRAWPVEGMGSVRPHIRQYRPGLASHHGMPNLVYLTQLTPGEGGNPGAPDHWGQEESTISIANMVLVAPARSATPSSFALSPFSDLRDCPPPPLAVAGPCNRTSGWARTDANP